MMPARLGISELSPVPSAVRLQEYRMRVSNEKERFGVWHEY